MRSLLVFAVLVGLLTAAAAEDQKPDDPKKPAVETKKVEPKKVVPKKIEPKKVERPEPTLKVGDPAPKLVADKWLQGDPVSKFGGGKIHVVEFWATWCGPCIVMMPHMSELQSEYRNKDVTLIGFTSKDPNNTAEKVAAFVTKRGPKLGYTFAYEDNRDTNTAWMRAAGQNGIPCCFVVDRAGTIVYIGHPLFLDVVLPKVVVGTWDPVKGKAEVEEADKAFDAAFAVVRKPDAVAALADLAVMEKERPWIMKVPYLQGPKLALLARAKKYDELKAMCEKMLAEAERNEDAAGLGNVARAMTATTVKDQKELVAIGLRAAEAGVKLAGDTDLSALVTAARAYDAAGDAARAKGYATKAVAAAPNPAVKRQVEQFLQSILGEEKKEPPKEDPK